MPFYLHAHTAYIWLYSPIYIHVIWLTYVNRRQSNKVEDA